MAESCETGMAFVEQRRGRQGIDAAGQTTDHSFFNRLGFANQFERRGRRNHRSRHPRSVATTRRPARKVMQDFVALGVWVNSGWNASEHSRVLCRIAALGARVAVRAMTVN